MRYFPHSGQYIYAKITASYRLCSIPCILPLVIRVFSDSAPDTALYSSLGRVTCSAGSGLGAPWEYPLLCIEHKKIYSTIKSAKKLSASFDSVDWQHRWTQRYPWAAITCTLAGCCRALHRFRTCMAQRDMNQWHRFCPMGLASSSIKFASLHCRARTGIDIGPCHSTAEWVYTVWVDKVSSNLIASQGAADDSNQRR